MTLLIFIFMGMQAGFAEPHCPGKTAFDSIEKKVTEHFYDRNFRGLDWPALVRQSRQEITCTDSDVKIAEVTNRMLAQLKASHTAVYLADSIEFWGLRSVFSGNLDQYKVPFYGIWPTDLADGLFVKNVFMGSVPYQNGVRPGDKIKGLSSGEFKPIADRAGDRVNLEIMFSPTQSRLVQISAQRVSVQQALLTATQQSERVIATKSNRKIGYVHLWSGTHAEFLNAFNASLDRFKEQKVDALIIDLRDGFGGADPSYLEKLKTDSQLATLPKAFLINHGVRSGKEWIAALVKRDKLGTLIGTKTAGAFLAGSLFVVHKNRFAVYVAAAEFNPPDIAPIEGVGVSPDIVVEDCLRFCGSFDPPLDRAIEHVQLH